MQDYNPKVKANESYLLVKEIHTDLKKELKETESKYLDFMNDFLESKAKLKRENEIKFFGYKVDKREITKKYAEALNKAKNSGESGKDELQKVRNQREEELSKLYNHFLNGVIEDVESNIKQDSDQGKKYYKIKDEIAKIKEQIQKTNDFYEELYKISKKVIPAGTTRKIKPKKQSKPKENTEIKKEEKEVVVLNG